MLKIVIWGIALVMLATALVAWVVGETSLFRACISQANQTSQAKDESSTQTPEQNTSTLPVRVGYWDCAAQFVRQENAAVTAVATTLLTAVTLGLVLIGYLQISTTRAQLRAYVHVTFTRVSVPKLQIGSAPTIAIQVENSGDTPAFGLTIASTLDIFEFPEPRKLRPREPDSDDHPAPIAVHPGEALPLTIWRPEVLTEPELVAVTKTGAKRLYLFGEIRYRDTFGSLRKTRFRWMTRDPAMEPPGVRITEGLMVPCRYGNTAT